LVLIAIPSCILQAGPFHNPFAAPPTAQPVVISTVIKNIWIGSQTVTCPEDPARQCLVYRLEGERCWLIFPGTFDESAYTSGTEAHLRVREETLRTPGSEVITLHWSLLNCVEQFRPAYPLMLAVLPQAKQALPGETFVFHVSVTNLQDFPDRFDIAARGDWLMMASAEESSVLAPGESFGFALLVCTPDAAAAGTTSEIIVGVRSEADPTVEVRQALVTTIRDQKPVGMIMDK